MSTTINAESQSDAEKKRFLLIVFCGLRGSALIVVSPNLLGLEDDPYKNVVRIDCLTERRMRKQA